MYNLYENIYALCNERRITPGGLCGELGFRRSVLSDLKSGRKKSLDTTTLVKIADYFGVSVDRLLTSTEKVPASEGERELIEDAPDENYIILSRNAKKLSPEQRKQLLDVAKVMFKEEFGD